MLIRSPALQRLWRSARASFGCQWCVCVCVCVCVHASVSVWVPLAWVSRATPPCTGQSHTTWNPHGWHSPATLKAGWWTNLSFWTQGIHIPLKVRAPGPSWEEPSISGVRQSLQPPQPYIEWLLHRWVCDTSPSQLAWRKRTLSPCCQAARGGEWWAVPGLQRGQSNLEETPIQQDWAKLRCAPGRDYLNTLIQSDLKVVSPVIFNYVNP